ncbi:MAG: hypothetical protein RR282_00520 [Acinetobacter sp.]
MSEFETEIRQKIDEHLAKYKEHPNTAFLDEDLFFKLKAQKLINPDDTILGLNIVLTCQEHDFIHVTKIEK